ncbi:MAG: site-specific integrase, partial [Actinomycetia bacterium]|nr:site-specific integrase [Actinomycetes bacterium]
RVIERLPEDDGPVVLFQRKRATGYQVSNAYRRFMKDVDIDYYPVKNFRHAFATEMLAGGASTSEVASAMGHTNYYITEAYLDLSRSALNIPSEIVGDIFF